MSQKTKYHSANRDFLLELIRHFSGAFTIKDVENSLQQHNIAIGTSTIYRIFDDFTTENIVLKELGENNTATYRYLEPCDKHNHCYLECIKCHRIFHMDCDHINKLAKHLSKEHSFNVINSNLTISGTCSECQEKA